MTRGSAAWLDAGELVRRTYAEAYGARISPDPDAFFLAAATRADGTRAIAGCAGCTYASATPFFSERYLDQPIESAIAQRLGTPVDRDRVIEIGPLAGHGGAGRELIRLTPIIAWSMGMEYLLCTVTGALRSSLERVGITFTPLGPADPDRIDPGQRAAWGSYYDQQPRTGFIELRALAPLFAEATGRYAFLDPEVGLLAQGEVLSRAGR
ncbi:thermostable hemolysin [Kitasatospora azatica]|uniref:thermostable hemolysin n=1 Tax=Kitasatospora azatica TaxID=58347 RepID=UPI001E6385C3|nr:thermostable hemolysin [Kitasatospora azatica]